MPSLLLDEGASASSAIRAPDSVSKAPSSLSGKKAAVPSAGLDDDMTIVASKHTGQSSKCLEMFTPAAFLSPEYKRTSLSAKLRGASWLIFI